MHLKNVLMVGNGINRIGNSYSWEDLLIELTNYVDKADIISIKDKPFPLLYEEIFLKGLRYNGKAEEDVKNFISELILKLNKNTIHERIMELGLNHILTTNYDYSLERVLSCSELDLKLNRRTRYSINRAHMVDTSTIWHIHGEAKVSKSILLGYEHYAAYIQKMRNYIKGTEKKEDITANPNFTNSSKALSWIDVFLSNNVYILGLNLDYVEIDLWWLLTYRAREKAQNKQSPLHDINITYIYPKCEEKNNISKLEILRSLDIQTIAFEVYNNEWEEYYLRALDLIASNPPIERAV